MSKADLYLAKLDGANLDGADLNGAKCPMVRNTANHQGSPKRGIWELFFRIQTRGEKQ